MADDYAAIASDYAWLVPDEMLTGDFFIAHHRDILDALPPDATILDCACGIGFDAISLARNGYRVHASDGSPSLVAEAERRATAAGVTVPFAVCLWEDLPHRYGERFDLVLCIGNSISQCTMQTRCSARSGQCMPCLMTAATLFIDSRNWIECGASNRASRRTSERWSGTACAASHSISGVSRGVDCHITLRSFSFLRSRAASLPGVTSSTTARSAMRDCVVGSRQRASPIPDELSRRC